MAQTTKRALAASLKKLLAQKPLDKITIVDIVSIVKSTAKPFTTTFRTYMI